VEELQKGKKEKLLLLTKDKILEKQIEKKPHSSSS
jgi:hypothetical protein